MYNYIHTFIRVFVYTWHIIKSVDNDTKNLQRIKAPVYVTAISHLAHMYNGNNAIHVSINKKIQFLQYRRTRS